MNPSDAAEIVRQVSASADYRYLILPMLYLDPGTGSLVFQWVVAGLVGGAFAIKMFGRRIAGLFKRKPAEDDSDA